MGEILGHPGAAERPVSTLHGVDSCPTCGALPCDWVTAPVTGWRPIETAPKDGTRLIGLLKSGRAVTISSSKHIAGWLKKPDGGHIPNGQYNDVWSEEEAGAFVPRTPTHWMPFPAAADGPKGQDGIVQPSRDEHSTVLPTPPSEGGAET